jgi:hypothetical protein
VAAWRAWFTRCVVLMMPAHKVGIGACDGGSCAAGVALTGMASSR